MPTYKLMYFNTTGRAEATRMLFALKGQEFEDYRFKDGEWAQIKNNKDLFPLGQCPVLLIDGKSMPHCKAINRHLAREFGFYGANNEEASQIDIIGETVDDIVDKAMPILREKDAENKNKLIREFKETTCKPHVPSLNDHIQQAGGRFFVGGKESLADVIVFCLLDFLFTFMEKEAYPGLAKFHQGLQENSKLSDYIKNRIPPAPPAQS